MSSLEGTNRPKFFKNRQKGPRVRDEKTLESTEVSAESALFHLSAAMLCSLHIVASRLVHWLRKHAFGPKESIVSSDHPRSSLLLGTRRTGAEMSLAPRLLTYEALYFMNWHSSPFRDGSTRCSVVVAYRYIDVERVRGMVGWSDSQFNPVQFCEPCSAYDQQTFRAAMGLLRGRDWAHECNAIRTLCFVWSANRHGRRRRRKFGPIFSGEGRRWWCGTPPPPAAVPSC